MEETNILKAQNDNPNIKPENHSTLLEDLKERTGLNIEYFEIQTVNFLRDTVKIKIFSKN